MVRAPRAPFLFLRPTRASGVRNRTVYECVEITAAAIDPFKSIFKNRKNRNRFNRFKSI